MRLHASGVCHSDQNAIDGTAATRCPAVLGHEGAGVVEAIGPGVTRRRGRRPGCALVAAGVRSVRAVPPRPAAPVRGRLPGDGRRRAARRHHSPVPRRPPGLPLLAALARSPSTRSCPRHRASRSRADVPFAVAALVGCAVTTRRLRRVAHRPRGARRPRRRVRLRRRRALGGDGRGRRRGRARGRRRREPRAGPRPRPSSARPRRWPGHGDADATADGRARALGRRRRPRLRGHRPARGDAGGVPVACARAGRRCSWASPARTPSCACPPG